MDQSSCINDNLAVTEVRQSATFPAWHEGMRDAVARAIIARRIDRLAGGSMGGAQSMAAKVIDNDP